jgi:decaprenylphospho-beta-D-ribofuranose 2-oxidase
MPPFAPLQLSGFNRVPVESCYVARAERVEDLGALVGQREHRVLARGAGRGYGDNALNRDEGVILTQRLDRLLAFDGETGIVQCEGGCTLGRIIETFLPRGWFPRVTPGTKGVTVGGCIAGDVHGKNHHRDGSFATLLIDFELLLPSGEVLACSREENADVFWATLGGMGLTGIILSARVQLRRVESAFVAVEYEQIPNLDTALARFAETDQHSTYSVAWIDCLAAGEAMGRSVLMRGEHARADEVPDRHRAQPLIVPPRRSRSVPFMMPSFLLNGWTVKAFNRRFYRKHTAGRRIVDYDTFFYPLDSVLNYDRMYGRRGFVQYQAVLPRDSSRDALVAMLRTLSQSRSASFLAVLKTMGEPSGGLLSFPRAGHTLALDLPNTGPRLRAVIDELDRIVLAHAGRIYLAKDAFATPEMIRSMYPRLDEFLALKHRLDPDHRLTSSLARRIGIA